MPWYDYRCPECGNEEIDVNRKITENVFKMECPICSGSMNQVIRPGGGFNLKGTGWFKSGYSKITEKKEDGKESNKENKE